MATEGSTALLKWSDYNKERVKQLSAELMERSRATYDRIGSLAPSDVTYENTLKASLYIVFIDDSIALITFMIRLECAHAPKQIYIFIAFLPQSKICFCNTFNK